MLSYISLTYVLGVWFSVIYLGEHYFVDVVAGMMYATFAYYIVKKYDTYKKKSQPLTAYSNG